MLGVVVGGGAAVIVGAVTTVDVCAVVVVGCVGAAELTTFGRVSTGACAETTGSLVADGAVIAAVTIGSALAVALTIDADVVVALAA